MSDVPLTAQESEELDALLARVCLPTFTARERDIARLVAREVQRLALSSQAANDFRYASSATQMARLAVAPLLTMTEERYQLWRNDLLQMSPASLAEFDAELSAQRLARARERRAVFDEVITAFSLSTGWPAMDGALRAVVERIEALRDREEA